MGCGASTPEQQHSSCCAPAANIAPRKYVGAYFVDDGGGLPPTDDAGGPMGGATESRNGDEKSNWAIEGGSDDFFGDKDADELLLFRKIDAMTGMKAWQRCPSEEKPGTEPSKLTATLSQAAREKKARRACEFHLPDLEELALLGQPPSRRVITKCQRWIESLEPFKLGVDIDDVSVESGHEHFPSKSINESSINSVLGLTSLTSLSPLTLSRVQEQPTLSDCF